ncbi:MAG: IS1380 family transposase [Candidatus Atribacteria bacterium]|nr:MAG: IS1380 family transposase [Candidatus Atribacteria bacterium]
MQQKDFGFKVEKSDAKITSRAGLVLIDKIAKHLGVIKSLQERLGHLKVRNRGYKIEEKVMDLINMFVSGGSAISDIEELRKDEALMGTLDRDSIMACSTACEFLSQLGEDDIENLSKIVSAAASDTLHISNRAIATLDADASFIEAEKQNAEMSYNGKPGYYPMLGFIAETQGCLLGEFRDGNASPAGGALDFLKKMVERLPEGIEQKRVRSDSAWFNHEVTDWCDEKGIKFTIGGDMNVHMQKVIKAICPSEWEIFGDNPDEKVAENVYCFEFGKNACRVIVVRKEPRQYSLFPDNYEYRTIITNLDWDKKFIVRWYRERATSENWIKELKSGFGLGDIPSNKFLSNSAYMQIVMLAYNLVNALKVVSLPEEYRSCTIKTLRFRLINIAGTWVKHARKYILKLATSLAKVELFRAILKQPFRICRT